jgi:hypothetical protein
MSFTTTVDSEDWRAPAPSRGQLHQVPTEYGLGRDRFHAVRASGLPEKLKSTVLHESSNF